MSLFNADMFSKANEASQGFQSKLNNSSSPLLQGVGKGMGDMFARLGSKNAPKQQTNPGAQLTPATGAPYTPMDQASRQALLQQMLMRARGGQPGGAPNAPLPAPNSNVPLA